MLEESSEHCDACGIPSQNDRLRSKLYEYYMGIISGFFLFLGILTEWLNLGVLTYYSLFLISVTASGQFVIPNGVRGVARRKLDQHFLMGSASIAAIIIGAPAEGASVMFLFYISILLEERAEDRVIAEIQSLVELEPPSVTIKQDDTEVCIQPSDVKIGDVLIVRPGGKIGLDGIIVDGATSVNQSTITGESLPVPKSVGDQVFAGTINQEGYIEIKVTTKSEETVLSKIIELVENSREKRSPTEKAVSRFSRIYTPIVFTISIIAGIIALLIGFTLTEATYRALTILVVSCPCAFAVSIPVTMVSAITGLARNGVLVKGGVYLEKSSHAEIVAFDKTGTLTEGVLSVQYVCPHNNHSKEEILSIAGTLETMSEHPIGHALIEASSNKRSDLLNVSSFAAIPGRGIVGQINNDEYLVGNRRLLLEHHVPLQSQTEHICGIGTMVYVAQGDEHFGTIILSDTLRENTRNAMEDLKQLGIETVMLTGDSENIADEVAREIGIDAYIAELLPHQKVNAIEELKKKGKTLYVGDGINDTPALVESDVGIAMGASASDAALESADIALMNTDLRKVPSLIQKSKKTMGVVRQNIVTSLIVKSLTGILAALGFLSLWMAIAFGDMGLTFVVIANALRLVRKK